MQDQARVDKNFTAMRYQTETGKHLDENTYTICPGSRTSGDSVPRLYFDAGYGEVCLSVVSPGYRYSYYGVRRVVTTETKVSKV